MKKKSRLAILLDRRSVLKKKQDLNDKEEEELSNLDVIIATACEDQNRRKVVENFKEMAT